MSVRTDFWKGVPGVDSDDSGGRGYNLNLPQLNPAGIIPIGPELDFWEPHGRESLSA